MNRLFASLFALLFAVLLLARLPSVVEPAGSDQGLYAYMGRAIARGEVPYRDAWDQKPPGVHFAYAAMYAVWSNDSVVAATDIAAALVTAVLLLFLGRRLWGGRGPGEIAALLYLLLANPAFLRLGGIYVRAQCETFIGVLLVGALLLIARAMPRPVDDFAGPRAAWLFGAGVLLGITFVFKYNAIVYCAAAAVTCALLASADGGLRRIRSIVGPVGIIAAGSVVPVAVMLVSFAGAGAITDLYRATISYNLWYSGTTYRGAADFVSYLLTFPVKHALRENDSLWFLGGLGCVVLLISAVHDRLRLVVPVWIVAACLSIAINSGRNLPQYFVQANPLLALAAGLAWMLVASRVAIVPRLALVVLLAIAVVRISPFDKAYQNTRFDLDYLLGQMSRPEYLTRFSSPRYSALAQEDLVGHLTRETKPNDRVYIFGFSGGAYVRANRVSASRFFWSLPVLAGFDEGVGGYGASGVFDDLSARPPALIVLQQHDWPAEGTDSATYFTNHPRLGPWLRSHYELTSSNDPYQVWTRRSGA